MGELGTRCTTERVHVGNSPPKVARAVLLPDPWQMHLDIFFETSRYNLSEVKEHFIDDRCVGEDIAAWLHAKLHERGVEASGPT